MNTAPMQPAARLLRLVALVAIVAGLGDAQSVFIDNGRDVELGEQRGTWGSVAERWTGRGTLLAPRLLGAGDARIEARIAWKEGVVAFVVGSASLDIQRDGTLDAWGDLFVRADLREEPAPLAATTVLTLTRRGDVVTVALDGGVIAVAIFPATSHLGQFGFATLGPATLAIERFAAHGNLVEDAPHVALWSSTPGDATTYQRPALLTTPRGTLLAVCERHAAERSEIIARRSTDGGRTWSETSMVWDGDLVPRLGHPCLVASRVTDVVSIVMTRDEPDGRSVWSRSSGDDGVSWTEPVDITDASTRPGWSAPTPIAGAGIELLNSANEGRLVVPAIHIDESAGTAVAHALISDGFGASWVLGSVGTSSAIDGCQIVEQDDGTVVLFTVADDGALVRTTSSDGGHTWSDTPASTNLRDIGPSFALIRATSEQLAFASTFTAPRGLTLRTSPDAGATWSPPHVVTQRPVAGAALAALPDGTLACAYEAGVLDANESIYFERFDLEALADG